MACIKEVRNQGHSTLWITAGNESSHKLLFAVEVLLFLADLHHNSKWLHKALSKSSSAVYKTLRKKMEECRERMESFHPQICFILTETHWSCRRIFFFLICKYILFHSLKFLVENIRAQQAQATHTRGKGKHMHGSKTQGRCRRFADSTDLEKEGSQGEWCGSTSASEVRYCPILEEPQNGWVQNCKRPVAVLRVNHLLAEKGLPKN